MENNRDNNTAEILTRSKLFNGIAAKEIEEMLICLKAWQGDYEKGETVIREGDIVHDVGVVIYGSGRSIKEDISGKITTVALLEQGDYLGALLSASKERKSPLTVQATTAFSVMFFPTDNILGRCMRLCERHNLMMRNFIDGIAEKALLLHERNSCLIKPTVREKVMSYLISVAKKHDRNTFTIPMDRSGMAEYLNVERSALSRELSRMKNDGLIDFYKSDFRLLSDLHKYT